MLRHVSIWGCAGVLAFIMMAGGAAHAESIRPEIQTGIDLVHAGNVDDARVHFEQLIENGDGEAMYHMGAIVHSGLTGPVNLDEAIYWYRKAAAADVVEAKFALGSLYYKGKGVPKDLAQSLSLFADAAEAGMLAAQYNLAMMHAAGLAHSKEYGADEDRPRAYKWFTIVLARLQEGDDRTPAEQGLEFLKKEMTRDEIVRGQEMAEVWLAAHPMEETSK